MKRAILLVFALILAGGTGLRTGQAQPILPAPATVTNLVQDLRFDLTAISQGTTTVTNHHIISDPVISDRITSASIIAELGTALGSNFSRHATLDLVTPINPTGDPVVQIRDGSNHVDVTGFVDIGPASGPIITSTWLNTKNGQSGGVLYTLENFKLQDQGGFPSLSFHFNVSGVVENTTGAVVNCRGEVTGEADDFYGRVSGTGDPLGASTLDEGSISGSGEPVVETIAPTPPSGPPVTN
jgi:hypothetical protein